MGGLVGLPFRAYNSSHHVDAAVTTNVMSATDHCMNAEACAIHNNQHVNYDSHAHLVAYSDLRRNVGLLVSDQRSAGVCFRAYDKPFHRDNAP